MKKIVACCVLHLVFLQGFSQFPFYSVLPMGVKGMPFSDTLLNRRVILQREGIKKIVAVETSSDHRKGPSFTTTYWVSNGRIEARYWCYRPSPDTAYRFCHRDTLLYNSMGDLQEHRAGDSKAPYLWMIIAHKTDGNASITVILKDPQKPLPDTSVYHHVYNEKGQLIRQEYDAKVSHGVNASLHYNTDGFLDSIQHENPAWGTYIFKRKQKGSKKEIMVETQNAIYQWKYNAEGQCISSYWSVKKQGNSRGKPLFSEVRYFYNQDGTIARVEQKGRDDNQITTVYSYFK